MFLQKFFSCGQKLFMDMAHPFCSAMVERLAPQADMHGGTNVHGQDARKSERAELLRNYETLLGKISELHAGYGYTVAQYLVDNNFTAVTLCTKLRFAELARAIALPLRMNDSIIVKNFFTSSARPFKLRYLSGLFSREIYVPLDLSKISPGEAVIHISMFSDARLQQAVIKRGGVYFELLELVDNAFRYIFAEESVSKLMSETPGLHAVAFYIPLGNQDKSVEMRRIIDTQITRMSIVRGLRKNERNLQSCSAYIVEDKSFSNEDWLELLCIPSPEAYNDENGYRVFKNARGKHVNIINGHRLTEYNPDLYDNTIFLFGGCNAFGVCNADYQTYASQLQKLLNENPVVNGKIYRVENYGHFLKGHYSDYPRVISSIKPKAGDIILFQSQRSKFSKYPVLDFRRMTLPDDYGYLFFDQGHFTPNLNRFIAEKMHDYLKNNIFCKTASNIIYKTRQIPLYGLQRNNVTSVTLPSEFKSKLEEHKHELRKMHEQRIGRIGSIVMNCNPFTLGHRYLIEYAANKVSHLYIFVVQEDKSFFPFKDRLELIEFGTADLENVTVLPSGQFIISSLTFSEYFQKESIQDRTIDPSHDIELFGKEIAPMLCINVRFAGEEPLDKITRQYNDAMRRILPQYGIEFEIIPRKESGGEVISASRVRKCLRANDFDAIAKLVPESTLRYLLQNPMIGTL